MTDTIGEKTYVRVAARAGVSERSASIVRAGAYDVAIFSVRGELYAYENACPHQGGPIGEGIVDGATVTCPWHAWCFDVRSGKMTLGDFAALRRFDLYVEHDAVFVATEPEDAS
ncbi:MAG: Rieske 2Fe-2S domain-containing protein [Candidatus Tumulicola sp.]